MLSVSERSGGSKVWRKRAQGLADAMRYMFLQRGSRFAIRNLDADR